MDGRETDNMHVPYHKLTRSKGENALGDPMRGCWSKFVLFWLVNISLITAHSKDTGKLIFCDISSGFAPSLSLYSNFRPLLQVYIHAGSCHFNSKNIFDKDKDVSTGDSRVKPQSAKNTSENVVCCK